MSESLETRPQGRDLESELRIANEWRRYSETLYVRTIATVAGCAAIVLACRAMGWIDITWPQALAPAALFVILSIVHAATRAPK